MQRCRWYYESYSHGIVGDGNKGDSVLTCYGTKKDGTREVLAIGTQVSGRRMTERYHVKCAFTGLYYNSLPVARLYHKPQAMGETTITAAVFVRHGYSCY